MFPTGLRRPPPYMAGGSEVGRISAHPSRTSFEQRRVQMEEAVSLTCRISQVLIDTLELNGRGRTSREFESEGDDTQWYERPAVFPPACYHYVITVAT